MRLVALSDLPSASANIQRQNRHNPSYPRSPITDAVLQHRRFSSTCFGQRPVGCQYSRGGIKLTLRHMDTNSSKTAQYMALFRALESQRPASERLFEDRLAFGFLTLPLYCVAQLAHPRLLGE